MNYRITTLFAKPIWDFKSNRNMMRLALRSGWKRSDYWWERAMTRAVGAWENNKKLEAKTFFFLASVLAWSTFVKTDIRHATLAANRAIIAFNGKHIGTGLRLRENALLQWQNVESAIETMEIAPRARSSLFHLRMETRHRETFQDNMRKRFLKFAHETQETIEEIGMCLPPKHRHYSRWRGERPNIFDDTRKILAACLLIIDRQN